MRVLDMVLPRWLIHPEDLDVLDGLDGREDTPQRIAVLTEIWGEEWSWDGL